MKRSLYVKKSKFSESQIVGILKEVELGAKVGEPQTESATLKRMYADLALMHHALKDVVERMLWLRSVVSWSCNP